MKLSKLIAALEQWAPLSLQEAYDNSGLQLGDPNMEILSAMVCLDCTETVIEEAAMQNCQLIISHHPLIFRGLKCLSGNGYVERTLRAAIKHDIALYAIHTNLDNVHDGVNGEIASRLRLKPMGVLEPKVDLLRKLSVFVPHSHAEQVREAMFRAGAGHVGDYDECSFNVEGTGTFRGTEGTVPYVGKIGERHKEPETRVEVIYPVFKERMIISTMREAHPYEEVAYDLVPLHNRHPRVGSGLVGEWDKPLSEQEFLARLKEVFGLKTLRHSKLLGRPIKRVGMCGGSGAFLINRSKSEGVDAYITGDVKYHEFFDADGSLLLADIGHFGSEQFTMHLIQRRLAQLFPTFAVRLTKIVTDPIYHY
ncbi:MAG: Nif3-like dinuclear metal center hexameric protein [Flavobacteriales bacterium]|nr:Nif3-like dinuclear metal center hexameric protein [Flavobacteriales bacterium]MBK6946476.1 Nif3-like dinuclear metal center hexameric protein [Flavobacteriales bacterium]MBK7239784.1 Nif3-like dinuclear metal center hexameric protein [Flavobacteriales bacterium]MBK7297922.1 Nif3-like dinuclear metal center hexameric protein [Flavobacteriales bacterium]MBK9536525.1 Nif3-like dinuclear metal center hexameric protein [Flavobacteriales bacterium]